MRRAREEGIDNITPALADARRLPFADGSFDGAYLVTVLGEIPDQDGALRELRRVVRPGGRIVVGELFGDPHMVTHTALVRRAESAGLNVERKLGGPLWHFTRLQA
jgi:ubiquinone/menaquinone biosynthesis C-methylase UbiE